MKAGIVYIAIFVLLLFILPMTSFYFSKDGSAPPPLHAPFSELEPGLENASEAVYTQGPGENAEPPGTESEGVWQPHEDVVTQSGYGALSFRVLDQSTGEVSEISLRDFVRGAVAAEMPVTFHIEALKAQAVAAHTYALYNHYAQLRSPDPYLKGADFAADPSNMKVYITEEKAKEFYGSMYADIYWEKICEAADSVLAYIIEYGDEPIVAAYHAISAGKTESASNVWIGSADYLVPAESRGDYLAPDYEDSVHFTLEEVKQILSATFPEITLSGDPAGWFSDIVRSDSSYITEINVCGAKLHGKDIRAAFGLRSHSMDIYYAGDAFVFVTYGYGHGVGLSQYGADFLARQGYTFDMILKHYYSGAVLKETAIAR